MNITKSKVSRHSCSFSTSVNVELLFSIIQAAVRCCFSALPCPRPHATMAASCEGGAPCHHGSPRISKAGKDGVNGPSSFLPRTRMFLQGVELLQAYAPNRVYGLLVHFYGWPAGATRRRIPRIRRRLPKVPRIARASVSQCVFVVDQLVLMHWSVCRFQRENCGTFLFSLQGDGQCQGVGRRRGAPI